MKIWQAFRKIGQICPGADDDELIEIMKALPLGVRGTEGTEKTSGRIRLAIEIWGLLEDTLRKDVVLKFFEEDIQGVGDGIPGVWRKTFHRAWETGLRAQRKRAAEPAGDLRHLKARRSSRSSSRSSSRRSSRRSSPETSRAPVTPDSDDSLP